MSEILTIASVKAGDKWMDFTFKEVNEAGNPKTYCCKYHVANNAKTAGEMHEEILNSGYVGKQIIITNDEHEFKFVLPRFHLVNANSVYQKIRHEDDWSDETEQKLINDIRFYANLCQEELMDQLKKRIYKDNGEPYTMNADDVMRILKESFFVTP